MAPRSVFITGASRGLGLEFVRQSLSLDDPPKVVFAACRDPAKATELQALAKKHKCLTIVKLDVTSDSDIEAAVVRTTDVLQGEGLNLLINNAGVYEQTFQRVSLEEHNRQELLRHFDVNAIGPLIMTQKFLPLLKKAADDNLRLPISSSRAAVVNISTTLSSMSKELENSSPVQHAYRYVVTKAAQNMVTARMSCELKDAGILVFGLCPGWVRTDMGGPNAPLDRESSIQQCWSLIQNATDKFRGRLLDCNQTVVPF